MIIPSLKMGITACHRRLIWIGLCEPPKSCGVKSRYREYIFRSKEIGLRKLEDYLEIIMPYKFLLAAAALTLAACSQAEAPSVSAPSVPSATKAAANKAVVTKTKAVLIYADWCGSCKILDPQIEKARAMGHIPGLEFVVLDYTTKDDANFYAQAETCLLYTSPSPRDATLSRMPSSA